MKREHALDLPRYHARHVHGDLTAWLTWFGDDLVGCLAITPTFYEGWQRSAPCIVLQRHAWIWSEAIGDGAHCARTSLQFAAHLRMSPGVNSAMRITSIIRDHLSDLLSIPPAPFEHVVVAEAIRRDRDTDKEHYHEVKQRV